MDSIAFDQAQTLGTVEGKVRAIVASMGEDVAYQFCNWAQANVALDKVEKPTIVYVLPPSGSLNFKWNQVKDKPNSQIAFVCTTDFDFDGTENDGIIEAMKRLAIRFVKALNESGYFTPIEGEVLYQVLYDHLDQNVTGVVLTLILDEVEGVSICSTPVRDHEDN